MHRARILVVDDDPGIRKGCRRALEEQGYRVGLAEDGAKALEELEKNPYDLILTDIEMPHMNGLELLARSRALHPKVPVLLFTAFSTVESAGEALKLGAAGYLPKPFELEDLYRAVGKALVGEGPAHDTGATDWLSSEAVLGSFLNFLLELTARTVRVDQCHFLTVTEDGTRLVARAAWGRSEGIRLGDTLPLSNQRPGGVLNREGPILQDPRFRGIERFLPGHAVCLPICEGRRILGVLVAGRQEPPDPTESEKSLLELYARYASILIGHAKAYQELQVTVRKLEEAQQRLVQQAKVSVVGQLVAGLVHDINNPLASIITNIQYMRRKMNGSPLQEEAELIEKGGMAIKAIVTSLLGFVRTRTPRTGFTEPAPLVRDSIALVQYQCRVKRVTAEVQIEEPIPRVFVDGQQLQQVLLNLLMNALQSVAEGGTIRVAVSPLSPDASPLGRSSVRIAVSDDGPGIPPAHLNKIFQPFFTTKKEGEGTGLGLARCKEIVEGHGGMIRGENLAGGGALFWVILPAEDVLPAGAARPPREISEESR